MLKGKNSDKLFTAILVVVIIGIIASLGYIVYDTIYIKTKKTNAEEIANEFVNKVSQIAENKGENRIENKINNTVENIVEEKVLDVIETDVNVPKDTKTPSKEEKDVGLYMDGYKVMGTIEIPKTNVNNPILEKVTTKSLEIATAILYPEGATLNKPGNVTIAGHNYRNGLFFSDNQKLKKGDVIYITDLEGERVTYTIYDAFYTTPYDTDYMTRDTQGAREISLSTCNDDSTQRLIILAREN